MNFDAFIELVAQYTDDTHVARLLSMLREWKINDDNVETLVRRIDAWFDTQSALDKQAFQDIVDGWAEFKRSAVVDLGGMTVNERLYWFGLFERFDKTWFKKNVILAKLHAKR